MRRSLSAFLMVAAGALLVGGRSLAAQESKEQADLAKALAGAKVTLGSGLTAAATTGRPVSAKFELEDGKLQLSVYTEKDGKFAEVVVDHVTGKVASTKAITEGEDLAHAKEQSKAMAKTKTSLAAAVTKAVAANGGFSAVSVFPATKDGAAAAEVTLHKASGWKKVTEKLD